VFLQTRHQPLQIVRHDLAHLRHVVACGFPIDDLAAQGIDVVD